MKLIICASIFYVLTLATDTAYAGLLDGILGDTPYDFMTLKLGDARSKVESWVKEHGYSSSAMTFDQFKVAAAKGDLSGKNFKGCFSKEDVDGLKGYVIFQCMDDSKERVFNLMKLVIFNDRILSLEANIFSGNAEKVFSGLTAKYGNNFSPLNDRRDIDLRDPFLASTCSSGSCQIVYWSNKSLDQEARLISQSPSKVGGKAVKLILTDFKTMDQFKAAVLSQRKNQGRKAASDLGI